MKLTGGGIALKKESFVLQFFWKHKGSYFIGLIFMLCSSYIQTLFPKVLGNTIDVLGTVNFDKSHVTQNIIYMIIIGIAVFICTYTWRNFIIRNARALECSLRETLFIHFQQMSPAFYHQRKTGDLIAYAINDIGAVRMTFGPATAMSINGLSLCVITIFSMCQIVNIKLTLLCLLPIPVIVFLMLRIGKVIQKRFRIVQKSFAAISDRVQENIYGNRVIKAYVQEEAELKKFEELNNEMVDANINLVKVSSMLSPMIELCFSISFVLNLIIGGNMVLNGSVTLGDFVAFNTYLTMLMGPVISIGRIINIFQRGMASYRRIQDILEVEPDITDGEAMINTPIVGNIEFRNLSFTYPGSSKKAINEINLSIKAGESIGIIGATGSGKTTLANLLLKLFNVERGQIFVDGIDLNDYSLDALRQGFGYVLQDNFIFSGTVEENITFFKSTYEKEEIEEASRISCIYQSIINFEKEFETVLGERGVNLSGGQKQRICLARALIRKPAILILDDALSALDSITESEILKHFNSLERNQTELIISHKVSSVKDCNLIVVLENGWIVEKGNHEDLMKIRGHYHGIYEEQANDNADV
ncbi:MAG TPA: ABC transporter ATP-binding protein [Firmicutes bacterium]|nr:ABC transporter ATP-binding protein [Bacillota bacterium]